jgi:D-inositol-3-phosphate glycosyltransferase
MSVSIACSEGPACPLRSSRILFILEYFYPHLGGAETLFTELTSALAGEGHRVTVLTSRVPGAPPREIFRGVEVLRVLTPRFGSRYFFTLLSLPRALVLSRRADLIHTSMYTAAFPAWLASRLWRVPVVITVHEVLGRYWSGLPGMGWGAALIARLLEATILRFNFERFVCDSEFTRERLLANTKIDPRRASVCYPAVDYAFWDPEHFLARPLKSELKLGDGTFLFLFFGRPGVTKGVEFLLEAVNELRSCGKRFHLLLLLGTHPPSQYRLVVRAIRRLGLESWISIKSPVSRQTLPSYLLAGVCVVVPSLSEGFGYSAIEAASLGCQLVITQGHSLEEVVGEYATLCPPGDAKALAETMKAVMMKKAKKSSPPTQRFTLVRHLENMLAVYRPLLNRDMPQAG